MCRRSLCFVGNSIVYVFPPMLVCGLQVKILAGRMIKWLKVGGYIFFRESCFQHSENSDKKHESFHYREPRFYSKVCLFKIFYTPPASACK